MPGGHHHRPVAAHRDSHDRPVGAVTEGAVPGIDQVDQLVDHIGLVHRRAALAGVEPVAPETAVAIRRDDDRRVLAGQLLPVEDVGEGVVVVLHPGQREGDRPAPGGIRFVAGRQEHMDLGRLGECGGFDGELDQAIALLLLRDHGGLAGSSTPD